MLLRPSRFGKSLFLSTLECYCDVRFKGKDHKYLFEGLFIDQDEECAASYRNAFYVLRIELPVTWDQNYPQHFANKINSAIKRFLGRHRDIVPLDQQSIINDEDFASSLEALAIAVEAKNGRLMVLVDEYDRAPMNALLDGGEIGLAAHDQANLQLRKFLGALKDLQCERYLITGILPVCMDGYSIFNVAKNLTFNPTFANMVGFTECEVRKALVDVVGIADPAERDRALEVMRQCYNGYFFAYAEEAVYNPQLVHHFVEHYGCTITKEMIATDESVQQHLPKLADGNQRISGTQIKLALGTPEQRQMLFSISHLLGNTLQGPTRAPSPCPVAAQQLNVSSESWCRRGLK